MITKSCVFWLLVVILGLGPQVSLPILRYSVVELSIEHQTVSVQDMQARTVQRWPAKFRRVAVQQPGPSAAGATVRTGHRCQLGETPAACHLGVGASKICVCEGVQAHGVVLQQSLSKVMGNAFVVSAPPLQCALGYT